MTGFGTNAVRTAAGSGQQPGLPQHPGGIVFPQPPRVAGYLRFILGSSFPDREDVLHATAAARGYQLVTVVRSTDVSTLAHGCPGILQIIGLIDRREIDGVLTLADYTPAWDLEVVRRISARIRERAFLDYVWPSPSLAPPINVNRTYR